MRKSITAKGKNVLVIGGGDTGSDCVGTANRQGAKKVYQYEILPKPQSGITAGIQTGPTGRKFYAHHLHMMKGVNGTGRSRQNHSTGKNVTGSRRSIHPS